MKRDRNYKDPVYEEFRAAVRKRDCNTCQMCGKKPRPSSLQVHHIQKWANAPSLRYEVSNGITLCYNCHKSIKGKEQHYVGYFLELIYAKRKK